MSALPEAPAEIRQQSEQLVAVLAQRIAQQGSISFASYMQAALYEPGLGYYASANPVFGADGDFVTASGLGDLFAKCLAQQCDEVLIALQQPGSAPIAAGQAPAIVEFGAGNGLLAKALLLQLAELCAARDQPPPAYHIIETSGSLRLRQREELSDLPSEVLARVYWHDRLPVDLCGVVIANEVMDAMPVERLRWQQQQLQQLQVGYDADRARFTENYVPLNELESGLPMAGLQQLHSTLPELLNELLPERLADGYCFEHNAYLPGWLAAVGEFLTRGAVLLIDYGYPRSEYFLPERERGTLMCYYRHHAHTDPYFLPGAQDITTHVDFTAVAEAADAAGFNINGYTTQSAFLQANGLLQLAEAMTTARSENTAETTTETTGTDKSILSQVRLMQEVKALCLPGSMGERFQVMGLTRDLDLVMQGFTELDLSHRL